MLGRLLKLATAWVLLGSCAAAQPFENCQFRPWKGAERRIMCLRRAGGPPKVDGALDEPWWQKATLCEQFTYGGGQPAQNKAVLMAAFDDLNLYLAATCYVKDMAKLKKTLSATARDQNVWGEDCIDFKISPDGGKTELQFLANANAARQDIRNSRGDWDPSWQCATQITQDAYILEMAIPLAELGVPTAKPGASMLFTFGRADRTTREYASAFEPYGDLEKAPLIALGTEKDFKDLLASSAFTRQLDVAVFLDRDQYPSFEKLATGRVRIDSPKTGGQLVGQPAIELSVWRGDKKLSTKMLQPVESAKLDFDLKLDGLAAGAYELRVDVKDGGEVLGSAKREFLINKATAQRSGRIEITVPATVAAMPAWPIAFGVPFPWGALDSPDHVKLLDAKGVEMPIQAKVTGRWSRNGSIRWLHVDFMPPVSQADGKFTLVFGPEVRRSAAARRGASSTPAAPLAAETDAEITVTTGPLKLIVPKRKTPGLAAAWLDRNADGNFAADEQLVKPADTMGPYLEDDKGVKFLGQRDPEAEVVVEENGPLKACVRVSGWHVAESGQKLGKFILRYYAYRGLPYVRMFHTFIITATSDEARYRDIAYSLPFPSRYYFFGAPRVDPGWTRGVGAHLIQLDDQRFKTYAEGAFKDEGRQAEGWVSLGQPGRMLTLAVKDFWQQFPKELEVTPNALNVHFWPAHGEDPIRTGKNLSVRNVYQQWFVHEGKVLDFKIPAEVLPYVQKESDECYPGALAANALGPAKSHEMLLYFHAEDWERAQARTLNRVFQDAPAAICSPQWVCGTKVFGEIAARDPLRFPAVEKVLDAAFANFEQHREMDRDYGMFNFGDAHHNWYWQERRWYLHRIWRNTHHGWTRWPWLLHARSGAKPLRDWADRNARHVADVDHCHYTRKEFVGLPWPRGKLVGGICDYKGFVHWAAGSRLCYNSAADAMLWHYYLTGNERSLTAALEHGQALIDDGQPQTHREGSGRATSAAAVYFHTWNNDYLEFLERTLDKLLGTQREDGSFPQWENFAPFLQRYVELTHSRRGMKAMARWADWTAAEEFIPAGHHANINILSHGYLYTGQEKHLRVAAARVAGFVDHVYDGEDSRYRGMSIVHCNNTAESYFLQEAPHYLAAVAKLGRDPAPLEPSSSVIRVLSREDMDGKRRYVFRARLRQVKDEDLRLRLDFSVAGKGAYVARLQALGGGKEVRAELTAEGTAWKSMELALASDGALDYELLVHGDQSYFVKTPITFGQPNVKEVYPILREGSWIGEGFPHYFAIPEGADALTLTYQGRPWPLKVQVFDPSGRLVGQDIWIGSDSPMGESRTQQACRVRETHHPRSHTGWCIRVIGYGMANLLRGEPTPAQKGYTFYFAADPDKFFEP